MPGGRIVAYRGVSADGADRDASARLASKLRVQLQEQFAYDLLLGSERLERRLEIYEGGRGARGARVGHG